MMVKRDNGGVVAGNDEVEVAAAQELDQGIEPGTIFCLVGWQ